jgi:adenine-specific DNA-methyltransferase
MSIDDIRKILKKYGRYDMVKQKYQRFKADKTENRNHKSNHTYEYLHILEKKS